MTQVQNDNTPYKRFVVTAAASVPNSATGTFNFFVDTDNSAKLKGSTGTVTSFGGSNTFGTIAVSGQSDVVADSSTDTLTLAAGSNITITTNAGTDTITINAAGGTSGLTLISSQTVTGSSVASVTFSSIAGTYKDLLVHFQARATGANGYQVFRFQFNADTGANYDLIADDTSGVFASTGLTYARSGYISGGSATANYAGGGQILIPNYAGTTFYKNSIGLGGLQSGLNRTMRDSCTWKNTAAITQVLFLLDANNIDVGSVISLYGVG